MLTQSKQETLTIQKSSSKIKQKFPTMGRDQGPVQRALPPRTQGVAGKAAVPSTVTHHTFMGIWC